MRSPNIVVSFVVLPNVISEEPAVVPKLLAVAVSLISAYSNAVPAELTFKILLAVNPFNPFILILTGSVVEPCETSNGNTPVKLFNVLTYILFSTSTD